MVKYTFKEHLSELKKRFLVIIFFFIAAFFFCYSFKDAIYIFLLKPLMQVLGAQERKIIYTGMTEAFFTYIKLSCWTASLLTIPLVSYQLYAFIAPGLHESEKRLILPALIVSPLLFYLGGLFVFYIVMPSAWQFFLSFESNKVPLLPIILEARISEYLSIITQLIIAFGLAFELPIVMLILSVLGLVSSKGLKSKRRFSIVIIFIAAAIFTPPDVLSQIALAIPLIALYEISIIICNFIEIRSKRNVRY